MTSTLDLTEIGNLAHTVLSQIAFGPPDLIRAAFQPMPEDYAAVFVGDAATQAAEAYASFWSNPPASLVRVVQPQIRVFVALAENIVESGKFPGGYKKIAHLLVPGNAWVRFKFSGANDAISYDGLVARGDRWAWFPKPWRAFEIRARGDDAGSEDN